MRISGKKSDSSQKTSTATSAWHSAREPARASTGTTSWPCHPWGVPRGAGAVGRDDEVLGARGQDLRKVVLDNVVLDNVAAGTRRACPRGAHSANPCAPETCTMATSCPVAVLWQLMLYSEVAPSDVEGPDLVLGCDDPIDDVVLGADGPRRGQPGG